MQPVHLSGTMFSAFVMADSNLVVGNVLAYPPVWWHFSNVSGKVNANVEPCPT